MPEGVQHHYKKKSEKYQEEPLVWLQTDPRRMDVWQNYGNTLQNMHTSTHSDSN